jgi:hypothetical protein
MKVETKYKLGQYVFTMFDNKIVERKVERIFIEVSYGNTHIIEYEFIEGKKYEHDVFNTKDELIKNL